MTSKYCGLCQRRHYYQAVPEYDAPRRRTSGDRGCALIAWGVVLSGYFFFIAWAVSA